MPSRPATPAPRAASCFATEAVRQGRPEPPPPPFQPHPSLRLRQTKGGVLRSHQPSRTQEFLIGGKLLRAMFDAAVDAASPTARVLSHLPPRPAGRVVVVGAGKASAAMAKAVEAHWDGPLTGLVVTRYGHAVPCERIEIVEAAHPVPDASGEAA